MSAELDDARVLITGGTGFIGCALIDAAFQSRAAISVVSRDPEAFRAREPRLADRVTMIEGDLRWLDRAPDRFTHVIHGASPTKEAAAKNGRDAWATIVDGTRGVLEFCARSNARLLLLSSGAVYGEMSSPVGEDFRGAPATTDPDSVYGEGKRAAEMLCALYADRVTSTIARGFTFSGRYLDVGRHYAVATFVRAALAGGPIEVSQPRTVRSYLDSSDMAAWLWTILFRGRPIDPYNVGSPVPVTMMELAESVKRAIDPRVEIVSRESAEASFYVPLTARAEEELGIRATVTLEESIRRMLPPGRLK